MFVGNFTGSFGEHYDLYYCQKGNLNIPAVIARYGNRTTDYYTGFASVPALQCAQIQATKLGYIISS